MKTNIFHSLAIGLLCCTSSIALSSCVDDESDYTYAMEVNDNTYSPVYVKAALDEQEQRMINYFMDGADKTTGMARNSSTDQALTPGPTGFGIMNIIAGIERGWISREDGAAQVLKSARFLYGVPRFEGAWAHWYNRFGKVVAFGDQTAAGEAVETSFYLMGMLTAEEYFTGSSDTEREIRELAEKMYSEVNWQRFIKDNQMYWIWHSDKQGTDEEYQLPIIGWNEALMVYILGLGAPEGHNIPQSVYEGCWKAYNFSTPGRQIYGYTVPLGSEKGDPLFLSQYSFLGLDPRQMQDNDANYWQQNVGETMVNRHYCVYEAPAEHAYTAADWGLTACGGAGSTPDYASRSPQNDDGVIAPTAAISSMPYTPFYSIQVLMNIRTKYPKMNSTYGIATSYKPSEKKYNTAYLAYEHGPQAIMIENYRSGLLWKLLMKNSHIQAGLAKAGIKQPSYQPGFYLAIPESQTGTYDMVRHPDRQKYEIDFWAASAGQATVELRSLSGNVVYTTTADLTQGANVIAFFDAKVIRNKNYNLVVTDAAGQSYTIKVNLH